MKILRVCTAAVAVFLCLSFGRKPFDVEKFQKENPLRNASNLHCYEVLDSSVTPAPCGYRPFYVSHIGRHGSRGHCEESSLSYVDTLLKLEKLGVLTQDAVSLTRTLVGIRSINEQVGFGELTNLGHMEHSNIARRMGEHYPEVFSNGAGHNIKCYSTTVKRVLDSRDSFVARLTSMYPDLEVTTAVNSDSRHDHDEVGLFKLTDKQNKELHNIHTSPFCDSVRRSQDYTRLIRKTFTSGKMPEWMAGREHRFFHQLFYAGMIRQCYQTDTLGWVEPYFTPEELHTFWKALNASHCTKWGWVAENKGYKAYAARSILDNIVRDADAVINGADTCATLRFTHDSAVYPLMCLIGFDGCNWRGSFRQISEHNSMSYAMHMAGNLQFVFFRNSRNDILVKILLNEEEVTIPALKPDRKGLFYRWDRLKSYFASLKQPEQV